MMKSTIIASMALASVAAANINVVSLGSSYAAGPGLKQPYGELISTMLANTMSSQGTYTAGAVSGSNLTAIPGQTDKITSSTNLIVVSSGGNDLNYVGCLISPNTTGCVPGLTISKAAWTKRFNESLDAIVETLINKKVPNPTKVPVYIVTYPIAIAKTTKCSTSNALCPLDAAQVKAARVKYHKLNDWTVAGLDAWKATAKNKPYNFKLIPMHRYSTPHDIESNEPWLNGAVTPADGNGIVWHPNAAGAMAQAKAVVCDFTGKKFPC